MEATEEEHVRSLLRRARDQIRAGAIVEADLASKEALHLTSSDDAPLKTEVLDELARIYREDAPARWQEVYTFPDAEVVRYHQVYGGGDRVSRALYAAARLRPGNLDRAQHYLLAAANVEALFSGTGHSRLRILERLWLVSWHLRRLADALAAARLHLSLIPDYPEYLGSRARVEVALGKTLMVLGRREEARVVLESAQTHWTGDASALELEVWLLRSTFTDDDGCVDEALALWVEEAERCDLPGESELATERLTKYLVLAVSTKRLDVLDGVVRRLEGALHDGVPVRLRRIAHEWLARSQSALGRSEEARMHLRKTVMLPIDWRVGRDVLLDDLSGLTIEVEGED